jgi:L-ascorbate metabolism protein UlaG (beta-lactamase superfamily)
MILAALVSIAMLMLAEPARAAGDVKVEWLTWSFFRITSPEGKVILTNPWYKNPDSSTTLVDIPEADIILVPTGHPDEVGNALEIAAKTGATIVASHDLINLVWKPKGAGFRTPVKFNDVTVKTKNFQPGSTETIEGITIRAVTALHGNWSTGGPAMGFFITMEDGFTIYFSGSTDLTLDMKLWGELFKPDAAILYLSSGMNPRDVALMAKLLSEKNPNLKTVFPQHHRLKSKSGRSPADLGSAMAEMGLKAKLIDPQPGVIYTLSK